MGDATNVSLIEFEPHRLDELIHMWRASFEAGVGITDPHPIADQQEYFVDEVLPRNAMRLALHDDQLVGFVAATTESVAQLYVRVGFHRRGIGTLLLSWAKEQSAGSLWLYTFARNQNAQAFYLRNGFIMVSRGIEPFWQLEDVKLQWSAANICT